jgi:hypothetical protein
MLILMQEGTNENLPETDWADYMYDTWHLLGIALDRLDKALLAKE